MYFEKLAKGQKEDNLRYSFGFTPKLFIRCPLAKKGYPGNPPINTKPTPGIRERSFYVRDARQRFI